MHYPILTGLDPFQIGFCVGYYENMKTKLSYSDQLKDPRWQKKRLYILQRDEFACKTCGDNTSTLHIHHKLYENSKNVWDYDNDLLITLCENCHKYLTDETNNCITKIRLNFIDSDKLAELNKVIDMLITMNPYDIMMSRKFVELYKETL